MLELEEELVEELVVLAPLGKFGGRDGGAVWKARGALRARMMGRQIR